MHERTKMYWLLLVLGLIPLVAPYCFEGKSNETKCTFKFMCTETIHSINLPPACKASTNHQVTVDVTLTDPIENTDQLDMDSLKYITSININGKRPETQLSILQHMPSLQNLYLIDNDIREIEDAAFLQLTNLETIDLSHNDLKDITELFRFNEINSLKRLSLADNKIEEIAADTFDELGSLISLDLSYNRISNLNNDSFFYLTNLQELRLNNNNITELNDAVSYLKKLQHLFLRGNRIRYIDDSSLSVIHHLKTFDLSDNQLENLRPNVLIRHWNHTKGVFKLLFAKNQIKSIYNGSPFSLRFKSRFELGPFGRYARNLNVEKLDTETELDFSYNVIDDIHYNAFLAIEKLTKLNLAYNKLTKFLVNPEHVRFVTYLNLRSNQISSLDYESFSFMTYLEDIDLSGNNVYNIPDKIFYANKNLKSVLLTNNKIDKLTTLPVETFNPAGGLLDFTNNEISQLIAHPGEGVRLTALLLSSNHICELIDINLSYHNELKTLILNSNCLTTLNASSMFLPKNLRILDLSANKINFVGPSTFAHLTELDRLNLSHNELHAIDYGSLEGLCVLSRLDLSYNKIMALDSKVLMDLKNLQELFLQHNGLYMLNYDVWIRHKNVIRVYLEDNYISCDWLATAVKDYKNDFSKMKPSYMFNSILSEGKARNSVENITCIQKETTSGPSATIKIQTEEFDSVEEYTGKKLRYVIIDDRLLSINQKILEVVRNQTIYLQSMAEAVNRIS